MASITPHKDGFRAQVYVPGKSGSKPLRDSKVFRVKRDANTWGARREAELMAQRDTPPADLHTLAEAFATYADRVSTKKEGAKWEQNRLKSFVKNFPEYAERPLSRADTPMWAEWRDRRLTGYTDPEGKKKRPISSGSVLREINLYRNVFTIARKEWKWIDGSPFPDMGMPEDGAPRDRRPDPWKEIRPIVRWLGYRTGEAPKTKSAEVALAWMVALRSGMRAKELRGLGKKTLNMKTGVAKVAHKMQYLTKRPREIPLPRDAMRLLAPVAHLEQCFSVSAESMSTLFRKAKTALLIGDLTFHDSRGEALTRLSRKYDVLTLSRISGIKDLKLLQEHYYRETAEQIAKRL
ncbi:MULTISPECIES: tyrosine-type recombinase/integrase [Paraburkholderia]|uniref:tyrosine-type recombinase/integrase n=1 Tax=Paraburkholderia TaxID=1822464 RepID=UPI002254AA04|nr:MULTISPECIES: tyrosine-type recombinase/integrase [Paraburkholderia]MCX4154953.1 tyrosine-type recombinase/integrase [Paraburkholderia aspalathi]MDN7164365.1 tyrosine-type recombinase/integrase [Paraburkholderia sp. SECH2]MDQ6392850.1 tyrosine-type recombinase/integrase [Paraburkholderia aspalathi]